ncbi:uncharacterized protein LOC131552482 isoform X1 [Onychostoma macrolepis]|uniref:uncharacterized protein LOC131552482 isoform X1 n=1 Tax=Onychostoma macrolepis TaxID=369639 RepID=UPI00272A9A70|nr:uncharacterized protein LOC131552482 isoform X1 [Onychostoma macrolepis]XP_058652290.1 uncharacterized protein LOC131552482 isoform X1 [Onychostoma macrolepis]
MDLHASRLVGSVTEYSATQGSSGFPEEHLPGMDTALILLALKQGPRSLKNYIREYLAIVHYSDLLIEFFCDSINQPLQSEFRREGPRSSLARFIDYALLTDGSLFTVGVAEGERNTASMAEIAVALEHAHKMAATAEPVHKVAATTTLRHVTTASHESNQVTVDVKEPSQVIVDLCESSQIIVDHRESSQVTVDRHESDHITTNHPESSPVTVNLHVSADLPESRHIFADHPVSPRLV